MSGEIISNEMIYFTGVQGYKENFNGAANCLNVEERMDYLKHFQSAARKWYEDDQLNEKAVSEEEIADFIKEYKVSVPKYRKEIRLEKMTAYTLSQPYVYKNLRLYSGACVEGDEICFPEKQVRPNACAKYELEERKSDISISFKVFISKDFRSVQTKRIGVEQPGKIIELRCNTVEKVKLKIYNTGEVCALAGNMWEPDYIYLGDFWFDDYNEIEITAEADFYHVKLNGKETGHIPIVSKGAVDSLFFDGGMHPRGYWKVKDLIVNHNSVILEPEYSSGISMEDGCEVTLPYAIGGTDYADRAIVLKSKFELEEVDSVFLYMQTLNPGGQVWVNEKLVLDTQNFLPVKLCITEAVHTGENEIKVLIEPRAPEVYYYWHRSTDCYNGWYCGQVSIISTSTTHIEELFVKTLSVTNGVDFEAKVSLNGNYKGYMRLYAQKVFPVMEQEKLLQECPVEEKVSHISIHGDFALWSNDNPVLYAIRCELCDCNHVVLDDFVVETGFRTIEQRDGAIYLNNKRTLLNGALIMQFLPPLKEVPVNHNCPTTEQIIMQAFMNKKMNGNTLRIHILGYGTDDVRYAQVCDRMGMMLIWVTGLIDSAESVVWEGKWRERSVYQRLMKEVLNSPSVIMWEGSNEFHPENLEVIDKLYNEYVQAIKEVDDTRLICPCSHLYYGGGLYDIGCKYYNDDGTMNQDGEAVQSGYGWRDDHVVRSAHTYDLLLGYGSDWEKMQSQDWKWQGELLESKEHAYLITEFAITALANPNTPEALVNEYVESYERPNELPVFERVLRPQEWKESQAYQALCAGTAVKRMRKADVDGMLWCCLSSGANNGSYMKPPIDFYGYKKLGYYALRESFRKVYACKSDTYVSYGTENVVEPMILHTGESGKYTLVVTIWDENDGLITEKVYNHICLEKNEHMKILEAFKPNWCKKGYYTIRHSLTRVS